MRWGEDGVDTRACESVEERAVQEVTASQFVLQFGYQCRVEIYAQLMVAPNKGADVSRLVYKVTSPLTNTLESRGCFGGSLVRSNEIQHHLHTRTAQNNTAIEVGGSSEV